MDWFEVPRAVNILRFSERMLWGLCDIQLYEVFTELPERRSWLGSCVGDKASGVSSVSTVLSNTMGNGQVTKLSFIS